MNEFTYLLSFEKRKEKFYLNINLQYEDYLVPVFNRSFLKQKTVVDMIYDQIIEYFNDTIINTTKNDLVLFYNAFKAYDLNLPTPQEVNLLEKKEHLTTGLTPKEMLFLMYIDEKGVKAKKAKYWVEEYHLDIDYTIKRLIEFDYITTDDYLFNLTKATVKDLCKVLETKDISCSGNKPDIIKKVEAAFSNKELKEYFSGLFYKQTIKGEEIALSNQDLNDFHKSYYRYANQLKIEEFYILNKRFKDLEAKEVCKMMVEKKNEEILSDFDWDKFFEEKIQSKQEFQDFANIVTKYAKQKETETKQDTLKNVSDEEFIDLVFSKKNEKLEESFKDDLEDANKAFLDVINKHKEQVVKTKEEKIENKEDEDDVAVVVDEKPRVVQVIEETEKVKKKRKEKKLNALFFSCFVYSSALCIIIIYSIYQFVLK